MFKYGAEPGPRRICPRPSPRPSVPSSGVCSLNDSFIFGPFTVRIAGGMRGMLALACLVVFAFAGCSGGGKGAASVTEQGCDPSSGESGLCVVACSLGCSQVGCSLTDIAQNQPIVFGFNRDIDPASVNSSSFSLRTATGAEPVGQFITVGSTVTFIPDLQVVGGLSFFGFEANETYSLTLPGGSDEVNAIRGTNGEPLRETFICNLQVSRGVIDLDGEPPTARMLSPGQTVGVDPQTTVVLEFSEIIDVAPFLQAAFGSEPVRLLVLKSQGTGGARQCVPNPSAPQVRGTWSITNDVIRQVSTATFTSSQQIPQGVCVEVVIDSSVRDLSGVASIGQTFQYFTTVGQVVGDRVVEELFTTDDMLDKDSSSADSWIGGVVPGQLGGDGRHGAFDPTIGEEVGPGVYEWSTDGTGAGRRDIVIPRTRTLSGLPEDVDDGVFHFSEFILPSGFEVRFVGSNPVQINVRGKMQLDGVIRLDGQSMAAHDGELSVGQAGGAGAAAAGSGGSGANAGDGVANQAAFNGADGDPVQLPNGGTTTLGGGKGAQQFPLSGSNSEIVYIGTFSRQVASGGGGGGYFLAGSRGAALRSPNPVPVLSERAPGPGGTIVPAEPQAVRDQFTGPPAAGGAFYPLFPRPGGTAIFDHFLVGGSGGGGGGSHPFLSANLGAGIEVITWRSGGGGAGGGGAFAARIGGDLEMSLNGRISAAGGSTLGEDPSQQQTFAAPGGGGSGGTIILQVGDQIVPGGVLDVSGGAGGVLRAPFFSMSSRGGDGAPGYLRIEAAGPIPTDPSVWAGRSFPEATFQNVAELSEVDPLSGVQSDWYRTGQVFPPDYLYYEVEASLDGGTTFQVFSDDDTRGVMAGPLESSSPIRFLVQGAKEDLAGKIDPTSITLWRDYVGPFAPPMEVGLNDDGATAFRFILLFDRSLASDIVVKRVTVGFRPL